MVAFMSTTSATGKDEDYMVQVTDDFNDYFKDPNRLKVVIWLTTNSYFTMGAESWFALTSTVAGKWADARKEQRLNLPQETPDSCTPVEIE